MTDEQPKELESMARSIRKLERMCERAKHLVDRYAFEIRFDDAKEVDRNSCTHWLKTYDELNKQVAE